jgi:hypothetical protein
MWATWSSRDNRLQVVVLGRVSLTGISHSPVWLRGPIRRFWLYFRLFQNPRREDTAEAVRETKGLDEL